MHKLFRTLFLPITAALAFCSMTAAHGASMVIDSLTGPPDQAEIDSFVNFMAGQSPPSNNFNNTMADHTSSQRFDALGLMYEATQDQDILDQFITWADHILAGRNDKSTKLIVWTGNIEPNWPTGVSSTDSTQAAPSTQGEQGWVISHMVHCAQCILKTPALWNQTVRVGDPHGYGSTYLARAKTYIQQADFTESTYLMKWFIKNNEWTFPAQSTGFDGSTWYGLPFPWNQQWMLSGALIRLADCHAILGDNPTLVSQYNAIVQTTIDQWYNHDLVNNQTTLGGQPAMLWHYEDPLANSGNTAIEDTGHAAFDSWGAWMLLYGTGQTYTWHANQLQDMANTVRYGVDAGGGVFNGRIDGTSGTQSTLQPQFFAWAKWYPQLYTDMANADRNTATTTPTYFAGIMWTKWAISKGWNINSGGGGVTLDTTSIFQLQNEASSLVLNNQGSLTNGSKITQ